VVRQLGKYIGGTAGTRRWQPGRISGSDNGFNRATTGADNGEAGGVRRDERRAQA
jgi:hypothetical protein